MGRQMVEQERAKGHLRAVRVTPKVILGPSRSHRYLCVRTRTHPAPNSGTVRKKVETPRWSARVDSRMSEAMFTPRLAETLDEGDWAFPVGEEAPSPVALVADLDAPAVVETAPVPSDAPARR